MGFLFDIGRCIFMLHVDAVYINVFSLGLINPRIDFFLCN